MNFTLLRKKYLKYSLDIDPTLKSEKVKGAIQILICIALFALYSEFCFGQENQNSDSILLNEANEFCLKEDYAMALKKIELCAENAIEYERWKILVQCQNLICFIGHETGNSTVALSFLKKYHSIIPDTFEIDKAYSAFYLGALEEELGNLIEALKYYQSTIEPFRKTNKFEFLHSVYGNLGNTYTRIGDYARANKYLNASKDITLILQDTSDYGYNIFDLALNQGFQENFQQSEDLYREYLYLHPTESAIVYLQLCKLKVEQFQPDSANIYFNKALANNVYSEIETAEFDMLYSDILSLKGNFEEAIRLMVKNEAAIRGNENNRDKGKYYYKLGDLYSKNGQWDQALIHFDRSLQAFTNQRISIHTISELHDKNYLFHEIWIGDIMIGLSKVYSEKYNEHKEKEFKVKAVECIEMAFESLDYKRSFFEDIESVVISNKKSKNLYEIAVDIYLEWYEENKNGDYLNKAFQIAQRHNAFVLRQQINERVKFERYSIEDTLKRQYFDQKLIVLENSLKLGSNNSGKGLERLKKEEIKLDSILLLINDKYPLFQQSKNDFSVVSSKQIQKKLDENKAAIKYFEGNQKLYSFVITKDKISYFVEPEIEDIKNKIVQLRDILSTFNYGLENLDSIENKYLNISQELANRIICKELSILPKNIKNLVIVPTGTLTQIPFEPLVIRGKKRWNVPTNYLINDYAISYNYFCKALISPSTNKILEKVLAYGLEYDEYTLNASKKISNDSISDQIIEKFRSEEMGHLYFADDEAREVAEIFGGISYTNENATKSNFLSNVSSYDIVHISAHSFVDFRYPSNSSIIFSKKDSLTDNLLQIKDVDRLTLNGQLFTLSACKTFFGKKNEGEGLSSMARSFIQSGAGSVIGSYWSVPDEITKLFMIRFYEFLKKGYSKDEALQKAKLDLITDDNLSSPMYRSPTYWSAWVIYGDTQSVSTTNNNWWLYLGIGLLILAGLYYSNYTRKLKSPNHRKTPAS